MRKSIIATFTAAVAVAAALLLTGCERAIDMTGKPVSFAAGISDAGPFSRSGQPQTRVSYGRYASDNTSQALDWQEGDHITIYCAQCENKQSAMYKVQDITEATTGNMVSYAGLANAESDGAGLRWGTGAHTFYAVYPQASATAPVTTIAVNVITGTIPASQGNKGVTGTDAKVVAPDMRNMYMTAKAGPYEPESDDVTLDFKPLTTVLEFTITNKFDDHKKDMVVQSVSLVSATHALNGSFSADLDDTGLYERPKTTLAGETTAADNNTVTINFGNVTVAYGKTLNFTFFLNPGNEDEVDDLTFVIKGINSFDNSPFTRRAKLEYKTGDGVIIPTHKKTRISGLMVPEGIGWIFDPTVQSWDQSSSDIDPMPETDGTPFVTSWDTDIDDELTLTDPYNGHEYVEIGGIKWATCNIGANSPKDYGYYFFWAGTVGYVRGGSKWVTADGGVELSGGFNWENVPFHTESDQSTGWTKYVPSDQSSHWSGDGNPDDILVLDPEDDAAHVNWGGPWRMPTLAEFTAMKAATYWKWDSADNGYYVYTPNPSTDAGKINSNGKGTYDKSNALLFFPAAARGSLANLGNAGEGNYWSGSLTSYASAYFFHFTSGVISHLSNCSRCFGQSVRPVAD